MKEYHAIRSIESEEERCKKNNYNEVTLLVGNCQLMKFSCVTKSFQNLFDDVKLKYWIFQGNSSYWLAGLTPQSVLHSMNPPLLPIGNLLSQVGLVAKSLFAQIYKGNNVVNLPDLNKAVGDVEIFLVTKEIEGMKHLVRNLFRNGEETEQTIPTSQSLSDEDGFDVLGKYIPKTGSIYLWVDKIYEFCYNQLLFQSVLLHELVHLLFDVMRRGLDLKESTEIHEETIDNCLVLYCYHEAISLSENGAENAYLQIRSFINSQSGVYADAILMFDEVKSWCDMRNKLFKFFQNYQ